MTISWEGGLIWFSERWQLDHGLAQGVPQEKAPSGIFVWFSLLNRTPPVR